MKPYFFVLLVLIGTVYFSCRSAVSGKKKEISLATYFSPDKVFRTTTRVSSVSVMDFSGAGETLERIQASGMALPVEVEAVQEIRTTARAGKVDPSGVFPVLIHYDRVTTTQKVNGEEQGGQPNPLNGMMVYGRNEVRGNLKIDSLVGGEVSGRFRRIMRETIEKSMAQMLLPDTLLKVGDSFDQEVPMSIPINGAEPVELLVTTTRTLTRVAENLAYFDLTHTIKLNLEVDQGNVRASGTGTGYAIQDLRQAYVTDYRGEQIIDMTISMGEMEMKASVKTISSNRTEIED